jgi:large subunit ribosomal protein L30
MAKLRVKLVKSPIDRPERQKRTLKALGLTKMQRTVEVEATPQVKGMVKSVQHLLTIEEI